MLVSMINNLRIEMKTQLVAGFRARLKIIFKLLYMSFLENSDKLCPVFS